MGGKWSGKGTKDSIVGGRSPPPLFNDGLLSLMASFTLRSNHLSSLTKMFKMLSSKQYPLVLQM